MIRMKRLALFRAAHPIPSPVRLVHPRFPSLTRIFARRGRAYTVRMTILEKKKKKKQKGRKELDKQTNKAPKND